MKSIVLLSAAFLICLSANIFAQDSMQKTVKLGDTAPDFTLTDQNGGKVTLSEAVKKSPVVLVFYRGYWCPFCARQLADLRGLLKENETTQLYAVSIDPAEKSRTLIEKIEKDGKGKMNYRLLSDPNAQTIDAYGLRDARYKTEKVDGIPLPTVYIIGSDRKIVWAKIEQDYKLRPTNEDIRAELDKVKK